MEGAGSWSAERPSAGDIGCAALYEKGSPPPRQFLMKDTVLACLSLLLIVTNGYIQLTQGGPETKYIFSGRNVQEGKLIV